MSHVRVQPIPVAIFLLVALALSACGGAVVTPGAAQPAAAQPSAIPETPKMTDPPPPSATPEAQSTGSAASSQPASVTSVPPTAATGFTNNPAQLPSGFPLVADVQFVAYNPAYDPCLEGNRDCAPGRTSYQVWLYEARLPALLMGPAAPHVVLAAQYTDLLEQAGYKVERNTAQGATVLTVTGAAGMPVAFAEIVVGPRVSQLAPPPDYQFVGLRISIEEQ
jgi:hypothetical protein